MKENKILVLATLAIVFILTFAAIGDRFSRFSFIAVDNDVTVGDSIIVTTHGEFNGTINVDGVATMSGALNVTGAITASDKFVVTDSLRVNKITELLGATTVDDKLVITDSIRANKNAEFLVDVVVAGKITIDGSPLLKTMSFFDPSPDADATMAIFILESDLTILQYDVSAETAPTSEAGITFYFRQGGLRLGEDSLAGTASSAERFKSHTANFDLASGACSLFIDDVEDANVGTANVNWLFQYTEKDD